MVKCGPLLLIVLLATSGCVRPLPTRFCDADAPSWAVYYDDELPAETFKNMDLVVFDRIHHPNINMLDDSITVLSYISLGEMAADSVNLNRLEKDGVILDHNPTWNSHIVDLKSPVWHEILLDQVQNAVDQGFDGVMLDTLDSPLEWARGKGEKTFYQMVADAVELIYAIRKAHPHMHIMLNRGFDVLPFIGTQINSVLAESILVKTDVSSGQFTLFSPRSFDQAAAQLHRAKIRTSHLQVYTLDYWNGDDVTGLDSIYAMQRARGFIPYVTTPDLRHFTPEPCL